MRRIVPLFLGFLFVIIFAACADLTESSAAETTQSSEIVESDALDTDKAKAIIGCINDYRAENGLESVAWSDELADGALTVLLDYLDDGFVSEEAKDGASFGQCGPSAEADGIFQLITNAAFFGSYMETEYLLNEDYTVCGAVFYICDEKTAYWCLKFG